MARLNQGTSAIVVGAVARSILKTLKRSWIAAQKREVCKYAFTWQTRAAEPISSVAPSSADCKRVRDPVSEFYRVMTARA